MAKKKQKEPEHAPRDYVYVRLYANKERWPAALLLETQDRASREGAPLDAVFYEHGDSRWIATKDLTGSLERMALGLDPMLVLCPLCQGGNYVCDNCGTEGPFHVDQALCEDEECWLIAGAIVCAAKKCAAPVSFSGAGVVDLSGDKPILNGWLRRMTDKDAELVETGKRPT